MKKYSIIIPVYNRPQEVDELLESLSKQTFKDFDLLIIEDGSTEKCEDIVKKYSTQIDIKYFYKPNSGPGDSRNYGMEKATGNYLIFFDSDCIIPSDYFENVEKALAENPLDAFGGPDNAHESFSDTQKAINYSMTSFITTGGVRGKKSKLDKFQPRSFNMGISQEVYKKVGGYSDIHPGEDPDLSYRIMDAGFKVGLIEGAYVYHKRRIDFSKFTKQVYKFGVVRTVLMKWHPEKFKLVYLFPALFLLFTIALLIASVLFSPYFLLPLLFLVVLIFIESFIKTKSLPITLLSIPASFIQLLAYGYGFLKGFFNLFILKREERKALPGFFFKKD
jgi:glycosyltransferase involved in cell wall biosynthesis